MKKGFFCIILILLLSLVLPLSAPIVEGESGGEISLTVVMYHSLLKSKRGVYVLSPSALQEDIRGMKEKGFAFVSPEDLRKYAKGEKDLPYKCALITFDDGHYNNLLYALPVLKEEGVCALVSVIGKFCQHSTISGDSHNPNYSYLTWADLKVLQDSGFVEIGNHTYALHEFKPRFGVGRIKGESDSEYKKVFGADLDKLDSILEENGIKKPTAFAFPFGRYNRLAGEVLKERGYCLSFTCCEGINKIEKGNLDSLFLLKRFNRNGNLSSTAFVKKVQDEFMKAMQK